MVITLNNQSEQLDISKNFITVQELLSLKKFTYKMLIVRVNGKTIGKERFADAKIKDGDKVDVIHLMSGG